MRNVYTFNLHPDRVAELVNGLRPTYRLVADDLLGLARFLDAIAMPTEPPLAEGLS